MIGKVYVKKTNFIAIRWHQGLYRHTYLGLKRGKSIFCYQKRRKTNLPQQESIIILPAEIDVFKKDMLGAP